jgi:cysteine desulfurase
LIIGGHQERDLRGGTENTAGIVGLGAAAELAAKRLADEAGRITRLRDRLEAGICERISIASINGDREHRLLNTTNISFRTLEAEALLLLLSENGIYVSSGSACSSGSLEPSHVLQAMGIEPERAHGAVRFSLSGFTTEAEIDQTLDRLPALIDRLAAVTP